MRLFTWVYPKFERLAEYTAEAVERLSAMGADGIYMMAPPEVSVTQEEQIEAACREFAEKGIEVHLGIVPFAAPKTSTPEIDARRYRYCVNGEPQLGTLCPSWPENREMAVGRAAHMDNAFSAPAVHLDFIRYFYRNSEDFGVPLEWEDGRRWIDTYAQCQCEACVAMREEIVARSNFNAYDAGHPAVVFKELEARKQNIDETILGIRKVVQGKLSIAGRVQYLNRALIEGQDWIEWCRNGLLEAVSPMNYGTDIEVVRRRIEENKRRLGEAPVEVLEGLAKKSSAGENSPEQLAAQVEMVMEEGADGAAIFPFHALEDEDLKALAQVKARLA